MDLVDIDGEEQVVLVLAPKVPRQSNTDKRYLIHQADLWRFSEEHNDRFEEYMFATCLKVWAVLDLGSIPSTRDMAILAETIQGGIDEMMDAIPNPELLAPQRNPIIVGEGTVSIAGRRIPVGVTEAGLLVL
jgi:hypothetical protein